DLRFDAPRHLAVLHQKLFGVFAPLTDAYALVGKPGAGFLDNTRAHAEIDQLADFRNACAIDDVKFDFLERRRDLVLYHLHARLIADHFIAVLDCTDAANVETDGGVEFQRVAAARRLRIAEHDADLHANLIDEDDEAIRFRDGAGEFAQSLTHQPRLQPRQLVTHLTFELGLGRERGDRIDHHNFDAARAHQRIGDLPRQLTGIRLRDPHILSNDT